MMNRIRPTIIAILAAMVLSSGVAVAAPSSGGDAAPGGEIEAVDSEPTHSDGWVSDEEAMERYLNTAPGPGAEHGMFVEPPEHLKGGDATGVLNDLPPGWVEPEPTPAEIQLMRDRALWEFQNVGLSEATLIEVGIELGQPFSQAEIEAARATPMLRAAPAQHWLPLIYAVQLQPTWCGPATGYMIAATNRENYSRYDGTALSQSRLASTAYMSTAANGTWRGSFAAGMNKWLGIRPPSIYAFTVTDSPSHDQLRSALLRRLGDWGTGMAMNTYEGPNGARYNRHRQSRTEYIAHFIMGYAYTNSGLTSHWADPGAHLLGDPTAPYQPEQTFGASSADIVTYAAARGIVS